MNRKPEAMLAKKELIHSMVKKLIDNVDSNCIGEARKVHQEISLELDLLQSDYKADIVRNAGLQSGEGC